MPQDQLWGTFLQVLYYIHFTGNCEKDMKVVFGILVQDLSSCWDGWPCQSKVGRKVESCCAHFRGELGPHLTHCRLGRGLAPCQAAPWSIQPFGCNTIRQRYRQTGQTTVR